MDKINESIPIWKKLNLTIEEAAEYSGIGEKKIREIVNQRNCQFVMKNGRKNLIKRTKFETWLENRDFRVVS